MIVTFSIKWRRRRRRRLAIIILLLSIIHNISLLTLVHARRRKNTANIHTSIQRGRPGLEGGGGEGGYHHHPAKKYAARNKRLRNTIDRYNNNYKNNGYSPNLDMLYDKDEYYGSGDNHEDDSSDNDNKSDDDNNRNRNNAKKLTFYERNDMRVPPLISRAERGLLEKEQEEEEEEVIRQQKERRVQVTNNDTADKTTTATTTATATSSSNSSSTTTLETIIQTAKLGKDYPTLLRSHLIRTNKYDRHAYPWDYVWYNDVNPTGEDNGGSVLKTGIPVELSINFHRVFSVNVIEPVLDLVVWMRIEWSDPRLTWVPEEYGGLTTTWFWIGEGGSGGETSEIWTPDIELWNLDEGLRDSFDDAYAIVSYDGSVWWSRPGHLRPICKYYGLDNFPFDKLSCAIEFGSWAYSGKYMRLVKGGGSGYSLGGSETAGASYNEFAFIDEDDGDGPIQCDEIVYPPFPGSPEEDWPVLLFNVTVQRSWEPYVRGYITVQVLLNFVGFSAFWLPPPCGERMSLSITAMLAAVASEIVVAANLPQAAEYTWFQKFSLLSMGFTFVSLLESVAVLYFFYKRSELTPPSWFTYVKNWYIVRQTKKHVSESVKRASSIMSESSDNAQQKMGNVRQSILRRFSDNDDEKSSNNIDDFAENQINQPRPNLPKETTPPTIDSSSERANFSSYVPASTRRQHPNLPPSNSRMCNSKNEESKDDDISKLLETPADDADSSVESFEKQDKVVDLANVNPLLHDESSNSLQPSDLAGDYGVIQTGKSLQESNISNISFEDAQDIRDIKEWKPTSRRHSSLRKTVNFAPVNTDENSNDIPMKRLSLEDKIGSSRFDKMQQFKQFNSTESMRSIIVPRDADDFNNEEEIEQNMHWKTIAARIDGLARFWIPLSFIIAIAIVIADVW